MARYDEARCMRQGQPWLPAHSRSWQQREFPFPSFSRLVTLVFIPAPSPKSLNLFKILIPFPDFEYEGFTVSWNFPGCVCQVPGVRDNY